MSTFAKLVLVGSALSTSRRVAEWLAKAGANQQRLDFGNN